MSCSLSHTPTLSHTLSLCHEYVQDRAKYVQRMGIKVSTPGEDELVIAEYDHNDHHIKMVFGMGSDAEKIGMNTTEHEEAKDHITAENPMAYGLDAFSFYVDITADGSSDVMRVYCGSGFEGELHVNRYMMLTAEEALELDQADSLTRVNGPSFARGLYAHNAPTKLVLDFNRLLFSLNMDDKLSTYVQYEGNAMRTHIQMKTLRSLKDFLRPAAIV